MAAPVTIALDAMGGDHGPSVVIPAAALALVRHPSMRFIFVGNQSQIEAELQNHKDLEGKSEVIHSDVAISMDAKPSQALRRGRWKSSMWLAIQAVRDGKAHSVVAYEFVPTWAFGELGFTFWNWPPLRPDFVAELAEHLGKDLRIVTGQY